MRLNSPLPAGADASGPQIVGGRVLYVADQLTNDVFELFAVPSDGSAPPVKLSGTLVTGGDVISFRATRQRIVYRADATVDEREELYSAPLDGSSAPIPLTPGLDVLPGQDVYGRPQLSSDGSLALFTTSDGLREYLHVVPIDGSQPPLLLADSGQPGGFYTYFPAIEIAPGDVHAVYIAVDDDDSLLVGDIFSVRLDGGAPALRLNQGPRFLYYAASSFRIAPNGERVLFTEDLDFSENKLMSVRMDGTGLVNLIPDGGESTSESYSISADSTYAVFASNVGANTSLYLGRLDGGQTAQILAPIAAYIYLVELAPGDTGVVYVTYDGGPYGRMFGLVTPNQPVLLSGETPAGQGVSLARPSGHDIIEFAPDGKHVVFRGDLALDEVFELYSATVDGSEPLQRLNPQFTGPRDVQSFRLAGDGKHVMYSADESADDVFELFSAPIDGSGAPVRLNQAPVTGGDVWNYVRGHGGRASRGP